MNVWKIKIKNNTDPLEEFSFYEEIFTNKIFKELEVRLYRVRCVEAWSMGIKYIGIPFKKFIKSYNPPYSTAKYVNLVSPFNTDAVNVRILTGINLMRLE